MIVYGTKIKSDDITFPLDLSHETDTRYEIEFSSKLPHKLKNAITCGFSLYWTHGRDVYLYSDREFDGSKTGQPWCYEVKDVVRFYWKGGGRTIYYELDKKGDPNLLSFWFIHLLLPLYMTLENMYDFIHAGAVELNGNPILFIASSMGGKSTLTDYFIKQGHTLVSDDKVPTFRQDGKFMAVGSHPYHRPFRDFEVFGYRVEHFTKQFKPIHSFYVLEKSENNSATVIEEINGFEKFNMLSPNYLYTYTHLQSNHMRYLATMLNDIKVFRVKRPWDLGRLREVYDAICLHSNEIS